MKQYDVFGKNREKERKKEFRQRMDGWKKESESEKRRK